jgi:two-component system nitrogen regulation response regulator GlnG
MPLELQTRLLRVLSDGQFYRVGGTSSIKSNVRVIAATHQDLEERVKSGAFREDLFHRLNVIRLRLPALRERAEDVAMLAQHFLLRSAKQLGVEAKRISDAALHTLSGFAFPGNVRQLENICHWLTVMAPSQLIETKDLPPEVLAGSNPAASTALAVASSPVASLAGQGGSEANPPAAKQATSTTTWEAAVGALTLELLQGKTKDVWNVLCQRFETAMIQAALQHTGGRKVEAAERLGMGRNTMTRKIQELGLE